MTDAVDPRLLRRAAEQAAEWYLDQREGLDAAQRARFLAWLRQSPLHVCEYLGIARLHGDLGAAAALDPLDAATLAELAAAERAVVPLRPIVPRPMTAAQVQRVHRTPWWQQAIAAAAIALIGGAAFLREAPAPMDVYTSSGEVRAVGLDDGTQMQLDRASAVAVRYDGRQRRIELLRGGALFDVGRDPSRPLRVRVGEQVLEDVGTVFDAHRTADGARVAVVHGQVRVWPGEVSTDAVPLADLRAGQSAEVAGGRLVALERRADLSKVTAWLPADIHFEHATVAEVARRFGAYGGPALHIDDPGLASTRISGRFHARDAEAFVAYLQTLPGVRVRRGGDGIRVARKL